MRIKTGPSERHTLSVTVTNEPGILARIAGMFSARGYNIESLTVADISDDEWSAALPSSPQALPP